MRRRDRCRREISRDEGREASGDVSSLPDESAMGVVVLRVVGGRWMELKEVRRKKGVSLQLVSLPLNQD